MDVVLDGIDEDGSAIEILQHGGHVAVEGIADGIGNDLFAIFRAENEVDVEAGEGLGHGLGRLFRALDVVWDCFPGRCPGLA